MHSTLAFVGVLSVLATSVASYHPPAAIEITSLVRPLPESAMDWTVTDVAQWVNNTLGYPEYSGIVQTHLVDGPTLLMLDVVESFKPSHPIHAAKMKAHIAILQGKCLCPRVAATDFWSYFDANRDFVFRLGSTLAYLPRVGFAYIFVFDTATYNALMGPNLSLESSLTSVLDDGTIASVVPWYSTLIYIVLAALAPRLLIAYKVALVWQYNFIIMSFILAYLAVEQLQDLIAMATCVGLLRNGKVSKFTAFCVLFRWVDLIPVAAQVLAFVMPFFIAQLLFVMFLGHCALATFSTVMGFIVSFANRKEKRDD